MASSGVRIINSTIVDNAASSWAGGVYTATFSYPEILNTIVFDNTAQVYPNMFSAGDDSFVISYSDIEGGWLGEGNIDMDPLFADPARGDYSLTWANWPIPDSTKSSCTDFGCPDSSYNDPDGSRGDLGAFYFDQTISPIRDLTITMEGNGIRLTWGTVPGALEYRVYSSNSPYFSPTGEPISVVQSPDTSVFLECGVETEGFYNIIAGN